MDLTVAVYKVTSKFPDSEKYGLVSQLRRASSSVPANIAEGHGRDTTKDYLRHLSIAMGSLCEVETFIQLSRRLEYICDDTLNNLIEKLNKEGKMLRGLQKSLRLKIKQESTRSFPSP